MRIDQKALQMSQRKAYDTIKTQVVPENISMPAMLIQEQAYAVTSNTYVFDFSSKAPQASSTLNNILLGDNNVFVQYGIQVLIGEGANANNRVYRSYGNSTSDNALYNGVLSQKLESNTMIDKMSTMSFRDWDQNFTSESGLVLINPLRVLNGRLGVWSVIINLQSISALTLTANLFISVRLHGCLGQATGLPNR